MSENCKTCHKRFSSGIWMSPQFKDEQVLLFCSEKCKNKWLKMKLRRLKWNYPNYYKKIMKNPVKKYTNKLLVEMGKNVK